MWNENYIAKLFGYFSHLRKGLSGNLQQSHARSLGKHSQQPGLISPGSDPVLPCDASVRVGPCLPFSSAPFGAPLSPTVHSNDQSNDGLTVWL